MPPMTIKAASRVPNRRSNVGKFEAQSNHETKNPLRCSAEPAERARQDAGAKNDRGLAGAAYSISVVNVSRPRNPIVVTYYFRESGPPCCPGEVPM
jgi:hypothetical protein